MRVELLYFEGCPNAEVAEERVALALRTVGRDNVGVERRRVETVEEAQTWGFLGSPTIRVDGVDPFASGTEQVGLMCRLYATPAGPDGSPTAAQLVEVLR